MTKKVTMSDIAEKLGVSTVTVSKALGGKAGVSDTLKEQIETLADEMGYERDKQSFFSEPLTIGVIVRAKYVGEDQSFYWSLFQKISGEAAQRNAMAYIEVINENLEEGERLPVLVQDKRVDGLIIMGTFSKAYREFLKENVAIPMVFLDSDPGNAGFDAVVTDNILGGYEMTKFLFDKGYEKICFAGSLNETDSIDDRYLGYIKACISHGLEPKDCQVIPDRDDTGVVYSPDNWKLNKKYLPDAFFCNCDRTAYSLMKALEKKGLSVPHDVAVCGFDNYLFNGESDFLTTYAISMDQMAKRAIHIILNKINNNAYLSGKFVLGGKIIERKSA